MRWGGPAPQPFEEIADAHRFLEGGRQQDRQESGEDRPLMHFREPGRCRTVGR
ncbi:hypothetical protein KPATCC21470_2569 [Kitasatospora purpeofusca]